MSGAFAVIRGWSRKYPAILNISRTGRVQSDEISLCIREQSLSREVSQSTVRRHWLRFCAVWPTHSTTILDLEKDRSRREANLGCRMADRPGWCDVLPKSLHKSCRMDRHIVVMKLICSLGNFERDGHTVHMFSQRRLTADWLAPRESECSRMDSKVSSDWLPSYIKATRPVLEIFKMTGYFPDSPRKGGEPLQWGRDPLRNERPYHAEMCGEMGYISFCSYDCKRRKCVLWRTILRKQRKMCHVYTKNITPIEWKHGPHLRFQYCIVQNEKWEYWKAKFAFAPLYKVSKYETRQEKQ